MTLPILLWRLRRAFDRSTQFSAGNVIWRHSHIAWLLVRVGAFRFSRLVIVDEKARALTSLKLGPVQFGTGGWMIVGAA